MRLLFTLLVCLCSVTLAQADHPPRPNIVLVMADDQGWGDMAYAGHPHVRTPHFDALAREGIRFDRFYAAAPVCSPTRGSVLTGRTPNRYACFQWGHPVRPQEETIAQVLQKAGYRTGHFGKWHVGSVQTGGKSTPGALGFDRWVSSPNFFDLDPVLSEQGKAVPFSGDSSDITADLALQFMKESQQKQQPFLAVVWFGSPHVPHQALAKDRDLYSDRPKAEQDFLGEITGMDRAFGRIRQSLKEMNLTENTVLWYCSDNGALPKVGSSGGRRGAKAQIYEGGLAVPALLEWPARFPKPRIIETPCVTSDILPTVLAMTGAQRSSQAPLDGENLLPILAGERTTRTGPIGFWNHPTPGVRTPSKEWMDRLLAEQKAGREPQDPDALFANADVLGEAHPRDQFPGHSAWLDGTWKLHRIQNPKTNAIRWELYDLARDPKEANDLIAKEPTRTQAMQKQLEAWLGSVVSSLNGADYTKR